jgi:hypothetical protein
LDLGRAGANVSRLELCVASLADLAGLTGASWCHCHDGDSTCHACQAMSSQLLPQCVFKGFQIEKTILFRVKPPSFKSHRVAPASGEVSRLEKLNLGQIQRGNMRKAMETICKQSLAKPPRHKSEWLAQPALVSCLVCMSKVISFCSVLGISLTN